ncbi:hypothetical protein QR46_3995 [Giardia duodenalis assemblage B]|uniref:Uncharacterized protein n=1 Tax=Giardia duodenalis assemblage B TaxID=1394984 RepID=A0A132NPJ1_GIAIN|nr:hypothetical protein QR46_3995 [Giardia intestinalis assemblage B]
MEIPGLTYKCCCQGPCRCHVKGNSTVYTDPKFTQPKATPPGCIGPNCPPGTKPVS